MMPMISQLADQIIEVLQRRDPPAAFVTEMAATIRPSRAAAEIEHTLIDLDAAGRLLVIPHAAPDIHLQAADLRVVAPVPAFGEEPAALDAAEAFWGAWLRVFLANHRCT